jgi:aminoglycoside/choline kinase family phosphotransferase
MEERIRRCVEEALAVDVRSVDPIHEGLGLRAFYRVRTTGTPESVVVRVDAQEDPAGRPAGIAPEPALEPLRTFLAEHGIPVPLRFGGAPGTDLLEDLGTCSLAAAARGASEAERLSLYEEACDLVVRFQRAGLDPGARVPAFERRLDRTLFAYKADLFAEWSLPTALGRAPRASEREAVHEAFEAVAELAALAPQRLAHRDFQSSNLYVRPGRRPGHRLAVIDFQGALLAPPEYDLVCLLRDSYVELPDEAVGALLQRVRPRLPDRPDAASFQRRFDALTLTRKGKDHARFLYAARARRERRFLAHLPATVRYLKAASARAAGHDERLARLDALIQRLPEAPCEA